MTNGILISLSRHIFVQGGNELTIVFIKSASLIRQLWDYVLDSNDRCMIPTMVRVAYLDSPIVTAVH